MTTGTSVAVAKSRILLESGNVSEVQETRNTCRNFMWKHLEKMGHKDMK
jgi:hypothetical protein